MSGSFDKVAIITGGTSGIGRAAALMLAQQGVKVAIVGRNSDKGCKTSQHIQQTGGICQYFPGNVANIQDCQNVITAVVAAFGRIDILINSAGLYLEKAIGEVSEEEYIEIMDVNMKGTYFMCKYALPELRKAGQAAIVNVSSDAGINGNVCCSAYCAAKGAVTIFTKALALELGPSSVRVNCVCPGDIDTPLTQKQVAAQSNPQEYLREMTGMYPLGRIGTAQEVANVICFLASEAASFVTGAVWTVDGGLTAG